MSDNTLDIQEISSQQIIYKLGVIETKMNGISENLTAAVQRFEQQVVITRQESEKDLALITARVERNERHIKNFEDWRNQLFTKLGFVVSAISLFWIIFAEPLKRQIVGLL